MIQQDLSGLGVYSGQECRELDRIAIEKYNIPAYTLMRRAAQGAYRLLTRSWPHTLKLAVFTGSGNNAGDGFVVAALAEAAGMKVSVYMLAPAEKLKGSAEQAYREAKAAGVDCQVFHNEIDLDKVIIVDAMLGTGLGGKVRGDYLEAIALINRSPSPVLAIDIPSGLCSDTGLALGDAVQATRTITFIGLKQGLLTARAGNYIGQLSLDTLDLSDKVFASLPARAHVCGDVSRLLEPRRSEAHKGDFGHVLLIGGDYGMAGAAALCGEACLRVGAGLVSVATRPEHISGLLSRRPELMVHGVDCDQDLKPLLDKASVLVIGPGLGQGDWSQEMLQALSDCDVPVVLDADGLNLLSQGVLAERKRDWVYTPHPGEAARMLGLSVEQVQADRFKSARQLQARYGGVVLLKGAGTVISSEFGSWVSTYGNPGMASGGMGDVLAGVIAGLLAQGVELEQAVCGGASLHGLAADEIALKDGQRGLLASDLMPKLRQLVNTQQLAQEVQG